MSLNVLHQVNVWAYEWTKTFIVHVTLWMMPSQGIKVYKALWSSTKWPQTTFAYYWVLFTYLKLFLSHRIIQYPLLLSVHLDSWYFLLLLRVSQVVSKIRKSLSHGLWWSHNMICCILSQICVFYLGFGLYSPSVVFNVCIFFTLRKLCSLESGMTSNWGKYEGGTALPEKGSNLELFRCTLGILASLPEGAPTVQSLITF